jgi:hypothetical protein
MIAMKNYAEVTMGDNPNSSQMETQSSQNLPPWQAATGPRISIGGTSLMSSCGDFWSFLWTDAGEDLTGKVVNNRMQENMPHVTSSQSHVVQHQDVPATCYITKQADLDLLGFS